MTTPAVNAYNDRTRTRLQPAVMKAPAFSCRAPVAGLNFLSLYWLLIENS